MKLAARTIDEATLPPEHRDWVRTGLLENLNQFMRETSSLLNGRALVKENLTAQLFQFDVTVPADWVTASLQSSWVAMPAPDAAPAYTKDPLGRVQIRGVAKLGTLASPAFNLPAAYRPEFAHNFAAIANGAAAYMTVGNNGDVTPVSGSNAWFDVTCSFIAVDRSPVVPSCFPVLLRYTQSSLPVGVVPWLVLDKAAVKSRNRVVGLDWEYASKSDGGYIKINNMPGLLPGKKYAVTLMAFAG